MNATRLTQRLRPILEKEYSTHYKEKGAALMNALDRADVHDTRQVDHALTLANEILHGYGIEATWAPYWVDRFYQDINLLYVNMEDTYAPTIIFDTKHKKWFVRSWGDHIELNAKRFGV